MCSVSIDLIALNAPLLNLQINPDILEICKNRIKKGSLPVWVDRKLNLILSTYRIRSYLDLGINKIPIVFK